MDKQTVSAIFLILLVIMGYQLVILPQYSPQPVPPEREATSPETPVATPPPAPPAAPAAGIIPGMAPPTTVPEPPQAEVPRRDLKIDRPNFRTSLDTRRGGVRSWRLQKYSYGLKNKEAPEQPVELLLPRQGEGALGITFTDALTESSFSMPLSFEEGEDGILLWGEDQYGLAMKRHYRFNPEGYDAEMEITFENRSETPRNISWEIFVGPDIDRFNKDRGRMDRPEPWVFAGGELDKLKVKTPGQRHNLGIVSWVGIGDRYFLSALAAREGSLTGFVRKDSQSRVEVGLQAEAMTLAPRQVTTYRLLAYLGPKDRDLLGGFGIGLEKGVDFGWFSWLAVLCLSILKFFHKYLHNWGLAILALTMVVKLALFPISQHMYRSMKKMQSLQPQIQALKKKFKDDAKALQMETMALYKQYKVNPLGGCLPMLIQMPVFLALYRLLYNAIELRGAGFLYIPDLSAKDPFYITPLLMGATMILQQRMSPTSADPKQAKMMMFMPVIFTAMFLNFASGLVLYFLFSNVISMGEQYLVRRWSSPAVAVPAVQGTTPRKGGKRKKR